jgi:hypothetical protein
LSTAIFGFANTLCFQFQIEDLPLKYRILGEDFKNKITGRSPQDHRFGYFFQRKGRGVNSSSQE